MLNISHLLIQLILIPFLGIKCSVVVIFQMRKLRHREVK